MKTAVHPSGITMTFDDEAHRYVDEHGQVYYSVTKVIHSLFPKFEKEKIAGFVARKRGCSREEVLEEWEDKRQASTDFGSKIHSYAEHLLKEEQWIEPSKPKKVKAIVRSYFDKEPDYKKQLDILIPKLNQFYDLLGTEYIIFSPEHKISGTVDLIMRNKRTGDLAIFDWKTNEEINNKNKHKPNQSGLYGLSHVLDCNFYHYALQLSTYKKMIIDERYFDDKKHELAIFHIRGTEIIPYAMPSMDSEASYILSLGKNPIPELEEAYEDTL